MNLFIADFIRDPLWDRARWEATTFGWDKKGVGPPYMGIVFGDADAGRALFAGMARQAPGGYVYHVLNRGATATVYNILGQVYQAYRLQGVIIDLTGTAPTQETSTYKLTPGLMRTHGFCEVKVAP